jgi:hypothetical protein
MLLTTTTTPGEDPFLLLTKHKECISKLRGLEQALVYNSRKKGWERAHPGMEYDEQKMKSEDDKKNKKIDQVICYDNDEVGNNNDNDNNTNSSSSSSSGSQKGKEIEMEEVEVSEVLECGVCVF